ncbi:MAG: hypothetical protein AAFP98_04255 [Pseudomonadota bacterium]
MSQVLKDNRLPLLISAGALAIAVYIGFIPVRQSAGGTSAETVALVDIGALEDRIAALEAAPAPEAAVPAAAAVEIPEGADNARLRQEIDLIVRGLANQTGRVSRLKATVEGFTNDAGQIEPSARVMDEIALAKRGLSNLTRRINDLSNKLDALDTAAADITRLQQQMANVDRAFSRLAAKGNAASQEREAIMAQLAGLSSSSSGAETSGEAESIEAKLDAILERLGD